VKNNAAKIRKKREDTKQTRITLKRKQEEDESAEEKLRFRKEMLRIA